MVASFRVTLVAALPAAICVGLNEQLLSGGRPAVAHEYVTLLTNLDEPTGETLRVKAAVAPAFTACAPEVLLIEKPVVPTTTNDKFCIFGDGAPVAFAAIAIGNVPVVVLALVLTVIVTATGVVEVGRTEFEGWKLQLAPAGKPVQESATAALNDPSAVTWKFTGAEVADWLTVTLAGEGIVPHAAAVGRSP